MIFSKSNPPFVLRGIIFFQFLALCTFICDIINNSNIKLYGNSFFEKAMRSLKWLIVLLSGIMMLAMLTTGKVV